LRIDYEALREFGLDVPQALRREVNSIFFDTGNFDVEGGNKWV
jgi:hypothetical protein